MDHPVETMCEQAAGTPTLKMTFHLEVSIKLINKTRLESERLSLFLFLSDTRACRHDATLSLQNTADHVQLDIKSIADALSTDIFMSIICMSQ